jgi:hypothetical protein
LSCVEARRASTSASATWRDSRTSRASCSRDPHGVGHRLKQIGEQHRDDTGDDRQRRHDLAASLPAQRGPGAQRQDDRQNDRRREEELDHLRLP